MRVSRKHGVNPSVFVCFFCGDDMGVALFGALPGDKEAPRKVVIDYDPCDKCKEKFRQGVLLIEASSSPGEIYGIPIQEGAYPTGSYVVISREFAKKLGVGGKVALIDKIPGEWLKNV